MYKPAHSVLLPELVVGELLPGRFPKERGCVQRESLQWLLRALRGFVGQDQEEMADTRHATLWAASVLDSSIRSVHGRDPATLFMDVALPLMRSLAFRDDEEKLVQLLHSLRCEYQITAATKTRALAEMEWFETHTLPRHARTAVAGALARCPVHHGGMVYACAFALAAFRLCWAKRRADLTCNLLPHESLKKT